MCIFLFLQVGKKSLPEEEEKEFEKVMSDMGSIYGTSTVCLNGTEWSKKTEGVNKCLPLSPDLEEVMAKSNDYQFRSYVWKVHLISCLMNHMCMIQIFLF